MTAAPGPAATGVLLVALAAALWGTVGIASKMLFGITPAHPLAVGFYRLLIAGVGLLAASWMLFGRDTLAIRRGDLLPLIVLGLAQAGYQGFYFGAVARVGVTLATLIALCSAPVLVAILASIFLGERMDRRTMSAIAVAIVGTVLLVGFPGEATASAETFAAGIAMACGAALSYACFALASRHLTGSYHPFQLIGLGFGLGALALLPLALHAGLAIAPSVPAIGLVAYMGLVATCLAYAVFLKGLRGTTATASAVVVLVEPLTASILAWLIFAETLGPLGLVGGLLLIGAVTILTPRNGKSTPPG